MVNPAVEELRNALQSLQQVSLWDRIFRRDTVRMKVKRLAKADRAVSQLIEHGGLKDEAAVKDLLAADQLIVYYGE